MPVNADNLHRLEFLKKRFDVEEANLLSEVKRIAERLEGLQVEIIAKATEEGHLFGSVTPADIVENLATSGFVVVERGVRLLEPIRSVGTYPVIIRLHPDVDSYAVSVTASGRDAAGRRYWGRTS